MNPRNLFCLLSALLSLGSIRAQLPNEAGAIHVANMPSGAIGLRIEDSSRSMKDGDASEELDMLRLTVSIQGELLPGISPWVEAGWHDPELQSDDSQGGFTWGTGVQLRPLMWPLRSDPNLGPRDWLALTLDLAVRGGKANVDAGSLEWLTLEGVVGLEWHKNYLGRNDGPIGSYDVTAGAGLILNTTEASQGSFDGSEDQSAGFRFYTGFTFGVGNFAHLELDLYGRSSRRLGLASGFKF